MAGRGETGLLGLRRAVVAVVVVVAGVSVVMAVARVSVVAAGAVILSKQLGLFGSSQFWPVLWNHHL